MEALSTYTPPQLRCLAMLDEAAAKHRDDLKNREPRPSNRYSRRNALANCGFFYEQDIIDGSRKGREKVLRMLSNALKREAKNRDRGVWTYDRNRHQHLLDTFKRELAAYEAVSDTRWMRAAA